MFKFELSREETNVVLNALAQRPFAEVYGVIGKFQQQASEQERANEKEQSVKKGTPTGKGA